MAQFHQPSSSSHSGGLERPMLVPSSTQPLTRIEIQQHETERLWGGAHSAMTPPTTTTPVDDAKDHDSGSSQNKVFKPNMVKIIRFWDRGPFDSATITNHTRKIKISETGESKSRKREKKKQRRQTAKR